MEQVLTKNLRCIEILTTSFFKSGFSCFRDNFSSYLYYLNFAYWIDKEEGVVS